MSPTLSLARADIEMERKNRIFPHKRKKRKKRNRTMRCFATASSSSSSSSFLFFSSRRRRRSCSSSSSGRRGESARRKTRRRRVSSNSSSSSSSSSSSGRRWITPKPPSTSSFDDDDDKEEERWIKAERKDSEIDRALISIFASRLAQFLNEEEEEEEKGLRTRGDGKINFERDVARRCVRAVAKSSSEEEQRMFGLAIIESFIPTRAAKAFGWFLRLFPEWFARRHAAFVTPLLLPWLVGDAEVNDVPEEYAAEESGAPANAFEALFAPGKKSQKSGYKQGVLVKRCRVLEESGCVSVCKNVCKIPTETFFTEKVGLPVTLIPNYETLECQFCYGRVADGSEGEEAGGCYVGCSASASKRCGGAVESSSSSSSSCDSVIQSDGSD